MKQFILFTIYSTVYLYISFATFIVTIICMIIVFLEILKKNHQTNREFFCYAIQTMVEYKLHTTIFFHLQRFFAANDKPDDAWVPYYEKFVQTIVHITRLDTELHKGDFYIHLSTVSPGQLLIKYYDSGKVASIPMQATDLQDVWSRDWTHKLRGEVKGRFHFLHCIVSSKRGLEKRPWRYLMNETRNVSYKQLQGMYLMLQYR